MNIRNTEIINQNLEMVKSQIESQWTKIQVEEIYCCPSITMQDIAPVEREPTTSYPYLSVKFATKTNTPVVQTRQEALRQIKDTPLALNIGQQAINVVYVEYGQNGFPLDHVISVLDTSTEPQSGEPVSDYGLSINIGFQD